MSVLPWLNQEGAGSCHNGGLLSGPRWGGRGRAVLLIPVCDASCFLRLDNMNAKNEKGQEEDFQTERQIEKYKLIESDCVQKTVLFTTVVSFLVAYIAP